MQPPTISGPNAASGPVNGLNSPTTSVDAGELPPPEELPPEELQAATDRSASAAASAVTASLITHLFVLGAASTAAHARVVRRLGGAAARRPRFLPMRLGWRAR